MRDSYTNKLINASCVTGVLRAPGIILLSSQCTFFIKRRVQPQ